jgi:hypothetical protein
LSVSVFEKTEVSRALQLDRNTIDNADNAKQLNLFTFLPDINDFRTQISLCKRGNPAQKSLQAFRLLSDIHSSLTIC